MFLPICLFALLSQDSALLTITTDAAVRVSIDGQDQGRIEPGERREIRLPAGEKKIEVLPESGGAPWRKLILASSVLPNDVKIPMRAHLLAGEVRERGYWQDQRTHLTWAGADNGSSVTVSQAKSYCRKLQVGALSGFRLPEIDELQTLIGGVSDERGFRVIAPLKLTGWAWSATTGNEAAEHWTLDFGDGARASVAAGDAGLNRALCVLSNSR